MIILVDTNVILDVFLNRKEFVQNSLAALETAISKGDRLYFSCSSITDVYYLIRRQTRSKETALSTIRKMCDFMHFAEINENCIRAAMLSEITDYEDAVIDTVASYLGADYILTRNLADFKNAINKVISPSEFLSIL